jgi:hypothetical protein
MLRPVGPIRVKRRLAKLFAIGALTVFVLAIAFTVGAKVLRNRQSNPGFQSVNVVSADAFMSNPAKRRIEGEIITLTGTGFEPRQIVRPPGPFLLVVDNRSGLSSVNVRLDGSVPLPLLNVLVSREKHLWSDLVELAPGNYTLREATHPAWVCNITIR